MQAQRHVEIAGAGFAGLVAALAFSRKGWTVRMHERSDELRMYGAGIWLWENGLRVLETLGVYDDAVGRGQAQAAWEARDHKGRLIRRREFGPNDRMIAPPRDHLYQALVGAVQAAGVKIETGSEVVAAHPSGQLVLASGEAIEADLVVGADGIHSKVRSSVRIPSHNIRLPNGATRLLVPRMDYERDRDTAVEFWSKDRVLLYTPVTDEHIYLCLVCPVDDEPGRQVPIDQRSWRESFPVLADVIERVGDEGRWDGLETVSCERWSEGRVAVIGDAAHGQPPWLGQAANLAMANALGLAEYLWDARDLGEAMRRWERAVRPVTDHVQRWTNIYGRVVALWPSQWESARSRTVHWFTRIPAVEKQLNAGPRSRPVGT